MIEDPGDDRPGDGQQFPNKFINFNLESELTRGKLAKLKKNI